MVITPDDIQRCRKTVQNHAPFHAVFVAIRNRLNDMDIRAAERSSVERKFLNDLREFSLEVLRRFEPGEEVL